MARPRKESPDLKDERDTELFNEYVRIMRSCGDKAPLFKKSYFYNEAAKKFFITAGTAKNIIRKMLKKKPSQEFADVRE